MTVTDHLPCGRDPVDVWDHIAVDRLSAHEQTCPYCQGVVSEYRALSAPTQRWRALPVEVPASLLERVLSTVRAGLRARNYLPLTAPGGPVNIDTATAEAALRWSLDQTDGARARSCKIRRRDPDTSGVDDGAAPPAPTVDIALTITARIGMPIPPVVAEGRELVRWVAVDLLGLDVARIDISVEDLFEGPDSTADGSVGAAEPTNGSNDGVR